ncbi:MAG: hypothetical protein IJB79_03500 [Candidatus Gastranaerophilales bacterium]|nr:hypothetical protein [Candidatus Gastranaerophilales bacterium]
MKKIFLLALLVSTFTVFAIKTTAQTTFIKSIKTCEDFSEKSTLFHNGEAFDVLITLNKTKTNKCIYREKIYQNKDYQMLTCEFEQNQQDFIVDSMTRFTKMFEKQISKNKIFEAKLTNNGEVFQKYLANPQYCKITYSKK